MPFTKFTDLDFDQIKESIKSYLRANSDFSGFDFEGSNFSVLLDTLAYNTYITAFNSNMVANNYRFCLTPDNGIKNVGTMALKLLRVEGGNRWKEKYGDDLVMLETFVQPLRDDSDNKRNGAVYLADNWSMVGKTKGTSIKKGPVSVWQREDSTRGELSRKDPKAAIKKYAVGREHYVVTESPIKKVFVKPLNKRWKKMLNG